MIQWLLTAGRFSAERTANKNATLRYEVAAGVLSESGVTLVQAADAGGNYAYLRTDPS